MKVLQTVVCSVFLIGTLVQCTKTPAIFDCDRSATINTDSYTNAQLADFRLDSFKIVGNCLEVVYSGSGCDGSTWELSLFDAGSVAESLPPQRQLRFNFRNNEMCQAYFTKTRSFDLSALQVNGTKSVLLRFDEHNTEILYEY